MKKEQGRIGRCMAIVLVGIATLGAFVGAAKADLITPTAAYVSTSNTAARGAANTINNSGLSTPVSLASTHTWGEDGVAWQSNNGSGIDGQWIAFNLGGAYSLTQIHVWNYRQASYDGRAMKNIDVYVSSLENPALPAQGQTITHANLLALGGGDDWTRAIDNHTLLRVSASSPEAVQSFALVASNVRWVIIRVDGVANTGNYGDAGRTGLFEVKFTGSVVTPNQGTIIAVR